jgi:hypothetical protein
MLGVTIYGEKMRIEKEGEEDCDMLGEVSNIHKPFFLLKGGRYDVHLVDGMNRDTDTLLEQLEQLRTNQLARRVAGGGHSGRRR